MATNAVRVARNASEFIAKAEAALGPISILVNNAGVGGDGMALEMTPEVFDQTIAGWRRSGDPALERLLRPALELHVAWLRECFDPDDDGLYESYINTLPTDSVWYGEPIPES